MITSAHNPKIQLVRALLSRRQERTQSSSFVVEGVRLTEEALHAGWQARLVLFSEGLNERGRRVVSGFQSQGTEIEEVRPELLKSLADTDTPQGILAVIQQQTLPFPQNPSFLLVLDQLRDPGNLGTILRTALSAGVEGLLLTPGSTDPYSPKVVRAGMGAHFRLPIRIAAPEEIQHLCTSARPPLQMLLAEVEGGTPLWQSPLREPTALIIGGEAEGASTAVRNMVDGNIYIPMPGNAESLNAAVAAAVLIFEVLRQRTI